MFKNLLNLGASVVAAADSAIGIVTKPISDSAILFSESVSEILDDE